ARGQVRAILAAHGWTLVKGGENEYWRRPGKTSGSSATLRGGVFYVFSSNAAPFEPNRGYPPFAVYALLEHAGDFAQAATALRQIGYGAPAQPDPEVDLSKLQVQGQFIEVPAQDDEPPPAETAVDPGPFPRALLDVPGFIAGVMAYNLATAPRPQPILALAGALSLMAILAGRKVRDHRENRTNLYIVCLANSGEGKGHAMKVNRKILYAAGLSRLEGPSRIASDSGLLTMLDGHPARLVQLDEFGRYLATMGDPRRSPHLHGIVTTLMELYSSADTVYYDKAYADNKRTREPIDQPFVCLLAVSAADPFRAALTKDSLSDGTLARLLIFEPGDLPDLVDVHFPAPPDELLATAQAWGAFTPGGNLQGEHPEPIVATIKPDARERIKTLQRSADDQMRAANDWRASIWARATEKACRLALIWACSVVGDKIETGALPTIDLAAADWACRLSEYLTRRLVFTADAYVSENAFDAVQQRIVRELRRAGGAIGHNELTRRLQRIPPRVRQEAIENLRDVGRLFFKEISTGKRPKGIWSLAW
ncbi:MAG TPA: DUF3987 domain-containing protein, partial [Phycisphaerae bacterium]|nr:DUF3987 domain-containing protein [Phycisphaerae bacterium]